MCSYLHSLLPINYIHLCDSKINNDIYFIKYIQTLLNGFCNAIYPIEILMEISSSSSQNIYTLYFNSPRLVRCPLSRKTPARKGVKLHFVLAHTDKGFLSFLLIITRNILISLNTNRSFHFSFQFVFNST